MLRVRSANTPVGRSYALENVPKLGGFHRESRFFMCTPLVVWSHQHCLSAVDAATGSPKHCRCAPLIVWSLQQRRVVLSKRSRRGVQGPAVCAPLIVWGRQQHLPGWASALDSDAVACCVYSASSLEPAAAPCRAEQTFPTRYPGACRVYSANSSRNQHCLQCSGTAAILLRKACLCTALIVRGRQQHRVGLRKRLDAVSRGLPCVLR